MRADIVPGAVFPDYQLPDHTGAPRRLSELQGGDPMALVLARGGYCPKEHRQHLWMAAMEPELEVGYCRFVTISTDPVQESAEWRQRLHAHWPFLSDQKRVLQRELEIQEYTDPEHDPMIPHTLLLEPGLVVDRVFMGYWYWGRPTPEEIRQGFRAISRRCRPDWDLAAPGLRDEWQEGRHERFYPYSGG